jgi:hypothetical protein
MQMRTFSVFIFALILVAACGNQADHKELDELKHSLFKKGDVSALPIYADPPTGDYEDMSKGKFLLQVDSTRLHLIVKYKMELEPMIIERLDSSYSWVYLAAYLRLPSAVPVLKQHLIYNEAFYGWEGGDYTQIERYLEDPQYPYQMADLRAIELITGKPVHEAIDLSEKEHDYLKALSDKCRAENTEELTKYCRGRWLLAKLRP